MRLDTSQRDDFSAIRALPPDRVAYVVESLQNLPSVPMRPERLMQVAGDALPDLREPVNYLVWQALMIDGWRRHAGLEVAEAIDGLREALRSDFKWTDDEITKWKELEGALGGLLSLPILRLTSSTIDLSYESALST